MNISKKLATNPLAVVFILVSVVVIYAASQFPDSGEVGPGFFPIVTAVGIILFAATDLFIADSSEFEISDPDLKAAGLVFVFVVAYVGLMPITGFLVGTMLFLPLTLYYSGVRSTPTIVAVSIVFPIILFYVFSQLFLINLPEGIIPFSRLLPRLPLVMMP